MLREWAYARAYQTSIERRDILPLYLTHYNQHRDHSSLDYRPPMTRIPGVHNVHGIHTVRCLTRFTTFEVGPTPSADHAYHS